MTVPRRSRRGSACFAPELTHAEFAWSKAAVSILLVLAGIGLSGLVCVALYGRRDARLVGLTERNGVARAGYGFLLNKYYLDFLYEQGVVGADLGAGRRAMNWINQNVIDGVVNGVGKGAVEGRRGHVRHPRPGFGRRGGQRRRHRHRGHRARPCDPSSPARSASTARCCSVRPPSGPSSS